MATFVSDAFTEGSDTALTSHTPETGGAWNNHTGTMTVRGSTDDLVGDSSGAAAYVYNSTGPGDNDVDASVDVSHIGSGTVRGGPVIYGTLDAGRDNYMAYQASLTGNYGLAKNVDGTFTSLGSYNYGSNATRNVLLSARPAGATKLEVFVDAVSRITSGDTDFSTFVAVGVRGYSSDILDNFSASDGTAGGGVTIGSGLTEGLKLGRVRLAA
ncbi:MAG: hypothetical protein VW338_00040 [Rhodospirillaceae bacterium]